MTTYETIIVPRYFECEPDAGLHPLYYARYAIQLAVEAGARETDGVPRLTGEETRWQLTNLGLRIHGAIEPGEALEGRCWLSRGGGTIWRRDVTLSRAGQPVVAGYTEWARAVGAEENERWSAYAARQATLSSQARTGRWDDTLDFAPDPPRGAFGALWQVEPRHRDMTGEMDPAWYLHFMRQVEVNASIRAGWDETANDKVGLAWHLAEFRLEVHTAAEVGDELEITSYIGDAEGSTVTRHAVIRLGSDQVAAYTRSRWTCFDPNTGDPLEIPNDWLLDHAPQMAARDDEE
jgi:acyl-CoA thioesterase FadM